MRKQPAPPPGVPAFAKEPLPLPEGILQQRREYVLITPLFGGGVLPNQADPVTVIRGTEIRAHLRFWWRACRGGQSKFNGDIKLMKAEEDIIWGSAVVHEKENQQKAVEDKQEIIHPVQITIEILEPGSSIQPLAKYGVPEYAAFPLLQQDNKGGAKEEKKVVKDIRFLLTITFPIAYNKKDGVVNFQAGKTAYHKDVEAALWAWETFGGIGARTRRGFGSIQLQSIDGKLNTDLPPSRGFTTWLDKKLDTYIEQEKFPDKTPIPHLTKKVNFATTSPKATPEAAWNDLIGALADFRQSRLAKKTQNRTNWQRRSGSVGRSAWPEAETIRFLLKQRWEKLSKLDHPHTFPRAAFGLPIIFHFKDKSKGDPPDVTLSEASSESDRMASPLILRPLACRGNDAVGLAIILEDSEVDLDRLLLKKKDSTDISWKVQGRLTEADAKRISVLNGNPNVLDAFLDYL